MLTSGLPTIREEPGHYAVPSNSITTGTFAARNGPRRQDADRLQSARRRILSVDQATATVVVFAIAIRRCSTITLLAMATTVFISSTFLDLAEHRRAVWAVLNKLGASIRGMEKFGARTAPALSTCLAEVDQSDIYVGIIGFRLGSIDAESGKSFTQREYERAQELGKEIRIYLADERSVQFSYNQMADEPTATEQLKAFKRTLRERHTTESFQSPADLAERLKRDIERSFGPSAATADEFGDSLRVLRRALLMPAAMNGREVHVRVQLTRQPYAASRSICELFNLRYGATVGVPVKIITPSHEEMNVFNELYAEGDKASVLIEALKGSQLEVDVQLQFSSHEVKRVSANFFARRYLAFDTRWLISSSLRDPLALMGAKDVYEPGEGKMILLLSRVTEWKSA